MIQRSALRRAVWASFSRVIGVILATGAGSIIRDMFGDSLKHLGTAALLVLASWILMMFGEYEREKD